MSNDRAAHAGIVRRDFLKHSVATAGAAALPLGGGAALAMSPPPKHAPPSDSDRLPGEHTYNGRYTGEHLNRIAFPLGGIGAGMICLDGTGSLSHVSLRHRPDVYNEPLVFSAICVKGKPNTARVLEGPVPGWKAYGPAGTAQGAIGKSYGLPRFSDCTFQARFPFATIELIDDAIPLQIQLTGWSPFTPPDTDASSLPVAALEYTFKNPTRKTIEAVYSFHSRNFMTTEGDRNGVRPVDRGFVLWQEANKDRAWDEGALSAVVDDPAAQVNCRWYRGGWWDGITMAWRDVENGACYAHGEAGEGGPSPGGTIFVPLTLAPGASKTVTLRLAWYVPNSNLREGKAEKDTPDPGNYQPWYAGRFKSIDEVTTHWRERFADLRASSKAFSDCFYDTTLPPEVIEAVAANLTILKSPTVLRQKDGRMWAWEGCGDTGGACHGSCTHVWNYAQAVPHLFPALERTLRDTEFNEGQREDGHQQFRVTLPIRPTAHDFHAASDGQLGGVMKVYREWRISGDTGWLKSLWPRIQKSLWYCIFEWDPHRAGILEEPHHNTYDIEFWGPDGMCTSFYLGALAAAVAMGKALGEDVKDFETLYAKGRAYMESELYDGEYFIQKVKWEGLRAGNPKDKPSAGGGAYSPESLELLKKEGPKYQYGTGCLSDGVLGAFMAAVCGLPPILDAAKVASHLKSVHKYNLRRDLSAHANPQRPSYALGRDGGTLLCSWPKGGELSLPFVYSNEVWTGIEYQAAAHLMMMGMVKEGLDIVRAARDRYDGRVRNPFCEYEYGHWYARALSSYALLQGMSGARYDALDRVLYLEPGAKGDFRAFLSTATGYGTVGVRRGKPFVEVKSGTIEVREIKYTARV